MTYPGLPDPFQAVRRLVSREVSDRLNDLLAATTRVPGAMARQARDDLQQRADDLMSLLARQPHHIANAIADSFRGPFSRSLTSGEQALVIEAFGQRVPPANVRIVNGPGLSAFAATAFLNGNPAITIGNTIYIKPSEYSRLGAHDLSTGPQGVEMLLHEYTHVVQYAQMGFAVFGERYAREFSASGHNAAKMYRYQSRNLHYNNEMIEGQAAMVGDYAQQRALAAGTRDQELIQRVRTKLRGTGIFGN